MPDDHGGRLQLVRAGHLDPDTAQTGGMRRAAAISGTTTGSTAIWMGETRVAPATISAPHHHGHSETAIYVASGTPAFVFADGDREVRLQTGPGDAVARAMRSPPHSGSPSARCAGGCQRQLGHLR